ncbi:A-type_flavoprotein 2 [Hexamita inflata]|uniref:A-type flavoprotein 2 n=1 Tax=Hexamita inflata TaxID=28002 RepID=A0AA86TIZ4_9EUKA|nr:A-type flavoprotein 2 [Hexamita inflata]
MITINQVFQLEIHNGCICENHPHGRPPWTTAPASLAYCRGLKLMAGKPCFLFGAYGWAGTQSANDVSEAVTRGGAQVEGAVFQWKLQVNEVFLGKLYEQGTKLGQKALDTGK